MGVKVSVYCRRHVLTVAPLSAQQEMRERLKFEYFRDGSTGEKSFTLLGLFLGVQLRRLPKREAVMMRRYFREREKERAENCSN